MSLHFEWDAEKAERNLAKHGVSFSEAVTVLEDPSAITLPDPDHSQEEERLLLMGHSASGRSLIVAITERRTTVRIISARTMTPRERRTYEHETGR